MERVLEVSEGLENICYRHAENDEVLKARGRLS